MYELFNNKQNRFVSDEFFYLKFKHKKIFLILKI